MEIRRVAVVGAGVMGRGIAATFARGGFEGHDGVKTGRGFYDWTGKDVVALRRKNADKLRRILEIANE
jgi:3-hydroxyacyl-CoA dehydrogenase